MEGDLIIIFIYYESGISTDTDTTLRIYYKITYSILNILDILHNLP